MELEAIGPNITQYLAERPSELKVCGWPCPGPRHWLLERGWLRKNWEEKQRCICDCNGFCRWSKGIGRFRTLACYCDRDNCCDKPVAKWRKAAFTVLTVLTLRRSVPPQLVVNVYLTDDVVNVYLTDECISLTGGLHLSEKRRTPSLREKRRSPSLKEFLLPWTRKRLQVQPNSLGRRLFMDERKRWRKHERAQWRWYDVRSYRRGYRHRFYYPYLQAGHVSAASVDPLATASS